MMTGRMIRYRNPREIGVREKSTPFGRLLRASRYGFWYSGVHNAYIRISWEDKEKGLVSIDVCPSDKVMGLARRGARGKGNQEYIVWWDGEDDETEKMLSDINS